MSLTLTQNYRAVVPGADFAKFLGTGGTAPYIYSVLPSGAGGSINMSTGEYAAPVTMTAYPPKQLYDTVQVLDANLDTATAQILIGTPVFLLCDILQTILQLPNDHIYLWDQKVFQPTDSNMYIAVSVQSCKPFSNNIYPLAANGATVQQYVNMYAKIDIDVISRGPAARDQKELVVLALNSIYSQQQQEANGFYIGKLPISNGFINLSQIDGAAIPYRFKISFAMQYAVSLASSVPYFDSFPTPQVYTDEILGG